MHHNRIALHPAAPSATGCKRLTRPVHLLLPDLNARGQRAAFGFRRPTCV
jgi:hypothetical protein